MEVPACGSENQNSLHMYSSSGDGYIPSSRLLAVAAVPLITADGEFWHNARPILEA
jgi:hypothetical protein